MLAVCWIEYDGLTLLWLELVHIRMWCLLLYMLDMLVLLLSLREVLVDLLWSSSPMETSIGFWTWEMPCWFVNFIDDSVQSPHQLHWIHKQILVLGA